ncbi:hypothetical protein EON81_05410 [bacterium]|nr:MAG: hypothetical protein EON81_05410 [bacterium]
MGHPFTQDEIREHFGQDFLYMLVGAMDTATTVAKSFFTDKNRPYNQTLGGTIIRWSFRESLSQAREVQFTESGHGFAVQQPFNIGLWWEYQGIAIRGHKVGFDKFPLPGGADHRIRFFDNEPPVQRSLTAREWIANAAFLWTLDRAGDPAQLRLAGPAGFDGNDMKLHYCLTLPTTVAAMEGGASHFISPADDEEMLIRVPSRQIIHGGTKVVLTEEH